MGRVKESMKTYIKQNWLFLLIMLAGSFLVCLLMSQVVLYADDYSLGIYSSGGFKAALDYFAEHYFGWGGGYTSAIVITLISMGPFFWKAALALLLILFVGLSVKLLCKNRPHQKWFAALILWGLILIISTQVSRECIYWLDGGIAYLFSMFQTFLVFYFFYTRLVQKVSHKYDIVVFPIVTFFGGWSSAQSGGMSIVFAFGIILWQRFLKKEKIKPLYWIAAVLAIAGFCVFYFAPGNYVRMENFPEFTELGLFDRLLYRASPVYSLTLGNTQIDFTGTPFFVYLAMAILAIVDLSSISQEKNKKIKILRLCCSAYLLLFVLAFFIGTLGIPKVSSVARALFKYIDLLNLQNYGDIGLLGVLSYLAGTLAVVASLINSFIFSKRHDNGDPLAFITMLTGFLANFAMLMAPTMPYRSELYIIACMSIAATHLLIHVKATDLRLLPITLVIFGIMSYQLIFILIATYAFISILITDKKSLATADLAIFTCVLLVFAGINHGQMLIIYHRNKTINDANVVTLREAGITYAETGHAPTTVYLKRPYNEFYGFTDLVGTDWVESAVKTYFALPDDIDLQYEGEQQ